jgi:hypothetical protein
MEMAIPDLNIGKTCSLLLTLLIGGLKAHCDKTEKQEKTK